MSIINRPTFQALCCEVNIRIKNLPTSCCLIKILPNRFLNLRVLKVLVTLSDKTHGVCLFCNLLNLLIRCIKITKSYVILYRIIKQQRLLLDNANILPQTFDI